MNNRGIPQLLGYMGANMPDLQTQAFQDRVRAFANNYAPADVVERMNATAPKFKARPTTKPAPKAKPKGKQEAGPSSPQEAQSVAAAVGMMHGLVDAAAVVLLDRQPQVLPAERGEPGRRHRSRRREGTGETRGRVAGG